MLINKVLAIIFLLFFSEIGLCQGLISNDKTDGEYRKKAQKYALFSNDSLGLPPKVDLSIFAPEALNQEKWGTCVGISSAYYMRTILEARRLNITDKKLINNLSFSPSYLYNAIKQPTNNDCIEGTELVKALDFLKNKGIARLREQPYPYCGNNIDSIKLKDESKIMDYIKVFGLTNPSKNIIEAAKKALNEGSPLLIGVMTTMSLQKMHFKSSIWPRIKLFFGFELTEKEDFRLWLPSKSASYRGDHALCVVGYDDKKYGGAFQLINSWGSWWGDDGLFWIKYSDFPKVAKYCFQAYLTDNLDNQNTETSAKIQLHFGTFSTNNEVPFERSSIISKTINTQQLVAYHLAMPQEDNTKYFFEANLQKQTYLYLIGKNEKVKEVQILFPNADSSSALMGANTKFLLPNPQWNATTNRWEEMHYQLKPPIGLEYWLFLFSKEKLDIHELGKKLEEAKGSFPERILNTFGNQLVPTSQIKYDDKKIGFSLKSGQSGSIIPLLIDFEHISQNRNAFLHF